MRSGERYLNRSLTGEPDDAKISSPVRRGAAETEPYGHRADRLPYLAGDRRQLTIHGEHARYLSDLRGCLIPRSCYTCGMAKKPKPTRQTPVKVLEPLPDSAALLADLRGLIESARAGVAQAVYSAQVVLHWRVGQRILSDILKHKRATYGDQIVATVARQLTADYGRGFAEKSLRRMIQFADAFPDPEIVAALSRQLSWSHFVEIIPLKTDLHREFYAEMCRVERWGVRTLRDKIGGMLFERTALSRKPEELARQELAKLRETDQLSPDLVFRDPYFLDFLGLADTYSEKDLETAILREMERFILELGAGFAFVARQKRITVDNEDYYIDLLFFHRKLSQARRRRIKARCVPGRRQGADRAVCLIPTSE